MMLIEKRKKKGESVIIINLRKNNDAVNNTGSFPILRLRIKQREEEIISFIDKKQR